MPLSDFFLLNHNPLGINLLQSAAKVLSGPFASINLRYLILQKTAYTYLRGRNVGQNREIIFPFQPLLKTERRKIRKNPGNEAKSPNFGHFLTILGIF